MIKDRDDYNCTDTSDLPEEDREYVAVSLYYVDGPVSSVEVLTNLELLSGSHSNDQNEVIRESK